MGSFKMTVTQTLTTVRGWRPCHYYVTPTSKTWHNSHRLPLHNSGALPPVHELFKQLPYTYSKLLPMGNIKNSTVSYFYEKCGRKFVLPSELCDYVLKIQSSFENTLSTLSVPTIIDAVNSFPWHRKRLKYLFSLTFFSLWLSVKNINVRP
jgi:hypothetical protein